MEVLVVCQLSFVELPLVHGIEAGCEGTKLHSVSDKFKRKKETQGLHSYLLRGNHVPEGFRPAHKSGGCEGTSGYGCQRRGITNHKEHKVKSDRIGI